MGIALAAVAAPELVAAAGRAAQVLSIRAAILNQVRGSGAEGELSQLLKSARESWSAVSRANPALGIIAKIQITATAVAGRYFSAETQTAIANMIRTVFRRGA